MVLVRTMMGMMGCGCLGRWFWDGVVVGCRAPPFCPPRSPSPWPSPAVVGCFGGEGIPLPPLPSILGFPLSGDGVEWWFLLGESLFLRRALRFLRGARAVHERPLRGAFLFLVGVGRGLEQ